jgi:cell division protein FtsZ
MENKVLKAIINSQKENDNENVNINANDNSSNKSFFNNFDLNDESFGLVNVKVFGIGGAGCNAIKYILDKKPNIPKNISTYAINTDAKALKRLNNLTNQIVIGKDLLKGLGAGANPIIGKQAAIESEADIRKILTSTPTDILFIIAGMGKGTGSGASPEIARIAKELGIMTIGIINFPSLKAEGNMVLQNAHEHFNNLNHYLTSYTLISNDKIIDNADNCVGYYDAFERANDQIAHIIISTVELINGSSDQNIDFSDIKTFFNRNHIFQ